VCWVCWVCVVCVSCCVVLCFVVSTHVAPSGLTPPCCARTAIEGKRIRSGEQWTLPDEEEVTIGSLVVEHGGTVVFAREQTLRAGCTFIAAWCVCVYVLCMCVF